MALAMRIEDSWLNETRMATLTVADVDDDGLPDLVLTSASTSQIFILWHQGKTPAGGHYYVSILTIMQKPRSWKDRACSTKHLYAIPVLKGIPLYTELLISMQMGRKISLTYWANYKSNSGAPPVLGSPAPGVPDIPAQQYEAIGVVLGMPSVGAHIGFQCGSKPVVRNRHTDRQ